MTNSFMSYLADYEASYEMQQYCKPCDIMEVAVNKWLNIPVGLASKAKEVQNLQIYF